MKWVEACFCVIVVLSNLLSAKMVLLPFLPLAIPAGLFLYPFTFLLSDLVTEIEGAKRAKQMATLALAMNLLSLGVIQICLLLPAAGVAGQQAFQTVFGLSSLRIASSLVAYIGSQCIGIQLYALIKRWTGPSFLFVRSNAATWIAQGVDTLLVDWLYLSLGLHMPIEEVGAILLYSMTYKAIFSLACTPILYFLVKQQRVKHGHQL